MPKSQKKAREKKNFLSLSLGVPHKEFLTDNRTHIHINTHGGGRESEPRGSSSNHSGRRRHCRRTLRFAQRQQHVLFKRHRAGTNREMFLSRENHFFHFFSLGARFKWTKTTRRVFFFFFFSFSLSVLGERASFERQKRASYRKDAQIILSFFFFVCVFNPGRRCALWNRSERIY